MVRSPWSRVKRNGRYSMGTAGSMPAPQALEMPGAGPAQGDGQAGRVEHGRGVDLHEPLELGGHRRAGTAR